MLDLRNQGIKLKNNKFNQHFTSDNISIFMANSISIPSERKRITLLDPGAGNGVLSIALVKQIIRKYGNIKNIKIVAYEIDPNLIIDLTRNYSEIKEHALSFFGVKINYQIINKNYLYCLNDPIYADIAIINPPYGKIKKDSSVSKFLRGNMLSSTNYYSSFIEVAVNHMKTKGQLVAIIPRSFMNGKYFKIFRNNIFNYNTLKRIHLFESRYLFEKVIQENVIIHIVKEKPKLDSSVEVSYSYDDSFESIKLLSKNIHEIVDKENQNIIRIFNNDGDYLIRNLIEAHGYNLSELNIQVSTGPVVDFRDAKNSIYLEPGQGRIPYIFSDHITNGDEFISWPKDIAKKGNYLSVSGNIISKLRPLGNYVIVKRFSPKEAKHRVHAAVVPEEIKHDYVAFDNKLNYFHSNKTGLDKNLAMGLSLYLNSSLVEIYLSQITGSTQINSSDLEFLKYPSKEELREIGEQWINLRFGYSQLNINKVVSSSLKSWH